MAHTIEDLGLDGAFAYDHLWPMGAPHRPSFAPFPVLAAVATSCPSLVVGPLVARVGMVHTDHLCRQFETLEQVAPGRVIAALGTGDRKSLDELEGYGLPTLSTAQRLGLVSDTAVALRGRMPVWIGGQSTAVRDLALDLGVTVNLWESPSPHWPTSGEWNWAGRAPDDLDGHLSALKRAGATWAIFTPDVDCVRLGEWRRNRVS